MVLPQSTPMKGVFNFCCFRIWWSSLSLRVSCCTFRVAYGVDVVGGPSKVTSEFTGGLRAMLGDWSVGTTRPEANGFEDPTYTAELAQRDVLASWLYVFIPPPQKKKTLFEPP